ncbi:MAG: hypothetical protein IAF38_15830 [Bacteroidia bacterium]|nr:hypothetical protein [Bacteroidia bacterium]
MLLLSFYGSRSQQYTSLPFKCAFKWAPFGIGDVVSGPNMKVGLDYRITKSVYGGLDGGAIFLPYPFRNNSGFFVRKELKFFTIAPKSWLSGEFYYWGFEAMYKYQEFSRRDSITIPGSTHTLKNYQVYKNTIALHAKVGFIWFSVKNHEALTNEKEYPIFFAEFFAGAGIRQSTVYCAGLTDKEADNRKYEKYTIDVIGNLPNGTHVWPSFVLCIKFGWKLW